MPAPPSLRQVQERRHEPAPGGLEAAGFIGAWLRAHDRWPGAAMGREHNAHVFEEAEVAAYLAEMGWN